jgi:prophage antirepressor-like protein
MVIRNIVPMEEIKIDPNCIIRAFENHKVFIFNEETKTKKRYYVRATDVGNIVDIVNIHTSIANFNSKEMVIRLAVDHKGVLQNTKFLTSTGVYRLLYASKKPKAEKFRDWAADILDDVIFNDCNELKKKLYEREQEIIRLENIHKKEIKKIESEMNWLNKISKNKVTFNKFSKKTDGVYIGSDSFNHQNFIEKIGKATRNKTRERDLASSSAPDAAYKMVKIYDVFKGLEIDTEKYIHTILSPLHINSDGGSTEHFMIHRSLAIKVIDKIIKDQNDTIEIVNNYIDLLDENKYDFSLVEKLLGDNQDKLDKEIITKICDKCDQCLSIYKFVFDKEENNYSSTCETCIDNYSHEIYNGETAIKKQCTECEKILLIKNFYIKDAIKQTYRSKCISCLGKQSRELNKKIKEDPMILNKKCDKCHEILKKTMFFKDNFNEDDHFINTCISCYNKNIGKNHKHCNKCNAIKSVDNFASDTSKIDKKSTICKECRKASQKVYIANMPKATCDVCNKEVTGSNLSAHKKTKTCLAIANKLKK